MSDDPSIPSDTLSDSVDRTSESLPLSTMGTVPVRSRPLWPLRMALLGPTRRSRPSRQGRTASVTGTAELAAPHQAARPGIGEFAGGDDLLPVDQGGDVAVRTLDEPSRMAGEVGDLFGVKQTEVVVVDDVEIGLSARLDHAPIPKAVELGGIAGETPHRRFQGEAIAAGAVSGPIADEVGGHAGVTDQADVGPPVTEALHRQRVAHHLRQPVIGVASEVQQWQQQELPAVGSKEGVVADLPGIATLASCHRTDAAVGGGLVVEITAKREESVEAATTDLVHGEGTTVVRWVLEDGRPNLW